jgi:ketosteroid isomerase-like protein
MNPDPAEVRQIIERRNAHAMRSYASGDADSIAEMVGEHAWQMPPNAPPLVGREAIRSFWRNALQWGSWDFDLKTQDVEVNGPLAVERGKYRLRFTAKPEAPPGMNSFEDSGNYVVLWRREADGEWRGVWDAPVSERPMTPAPAAGDEKARLLERDREWAAGAAEGRDVEEILSFWTDDAKVYPPGAPVVEGKPAIREFVTGSLSIPGFRISWEPEEVVVAPSGDMGYTTGRNQLTMPDASGNLKTETGRYVTVWRREPDGTWRCVIDIWNGGQ